MSAMVGTVLRGPRGVLLPVVGCVLLTVSALAAGCARAVSGTPHAADAAAPPPAKPVPVADMLIEPTRFPQQYPAVVVDPSIVAGLLRQIDGVPEGWTVTPPECAPPAVAPAEAAGL